MNQGMNKSEAWNENMMECIEASRPHCILFILNYYEEILKDSPSSLYPLLNTLGILVGIQSMEDLADVFLEHGYIGKDDLRKIRSQV